MKLIIVITEGVPAQDEAWFYNKLKRDYRTSACWPQLSGHHQPGQANIGITAGHIAKAPVDGEISVASSAAPAR
ncbi:MAG: hypothetical protein R2704_02090 [Microthrixaceae bacterium]